MGLWKTQTVPDLPVVPLVAARSAATNVADLVHGHAVRRPDVEALVQPGPPRRSLTWAELDERVSAVASGLAARGLVAGHRVGLLGPNSVELVVAYLAVLRAGFVAVPLNPQAGDAEVEQMLTDSGVRLLLATVPRPTAVRQHPLTPEGLDALAAAGRVPVSSPQDRESLAVLLYTAGTSGSPKAAMLTHRALLAHLDHVAAVGAMDADATVLTLLPLFHVFGLNAVLGSWALAGARLVVVEGYDEDFFPLLTREHVTHLPVAPALLSAILNDDRRPARLDPVVSVVSGAAPLSPALRREFREATGLQVEQGYGLTEAAPGISATLPRPGVGPDGDGPDAGDAAGPAEAPAAEGPGHVGRPLPGVQVRIGDGSEETEPAEIFVRGDNLFSGYWPDGAGGPGPDGWFGTGDIGFLDGGDLHLVDRARELVVVNGFNVYPAEVEEALRELPGVQAAAVVGRPDPRTGEQVVAFVVADGLSVEDITAHCALRLAKFKRPGLVRLLPELPRGATGKIRKGALRRSLEADEESR
ncbi:MAG: putative fatty-acid--CoA ligase [Friedmanniella sp.]|nr:putative fatty-acid--CoA ligase [Friedmanniella sp.]